MHVSEMQISEISNKDELSALIINELKDIGVKYRKDKKSKVVQEKSGRKRIFRTHLHLLELTDVILANGGVVQIPKFVAEACNRILEQVETEGIFRKAGSSIRQKEIRSSLEAGLPLGKSHHVIDVANVVKSFFRELPEPLIPTSLQETLLRALFIGENLVKAIMLTCLLLPSLTVNTLAFFMQFLHTVALSSHLNKMPAENLAIIFTPGLMPFSDISSHRFNNHVKMVQLLIENANSIGTIPNSIINKLQIHEVISNTPSKSRSFEALEVTQKKKKKRRSGSLTHMFNGLRKMVGSAIGSSENLESTPENKSTPSNNMDVSQLQQHPCAATPFILKSTKKRKFTEPVCAFSAKKKKDLLALLPNNSGGLLPNTPLTKEPKKSRLSLGGRRQIKNISNNPVVTTMERRWSIVGSGWSKNKQKNCTDLKKENSATKVHTHSSGSSFQENSPVISVPRISKIELPKKEYPVTEIVSSVDSTDSSGDYVRISKNEYEAIKERVAAIETRISQEFSSLSRRSLTSLEEMNNDFSGPQSVQSRYEKIVETTEALTSPTTEHLAQQLSRGLKIRRSSEHRVMRSPSARKIGTIRRRSQEKVRLSRNQTWHISSTANNVETLNNPALAHLASQNCFYGKSNLKRGRPNTLHTGLLQQQCAPLNEVEHCELESTFEKSGFDDNWTDGQVFFSDGLSEVCSQQQPNVFPKVQIDKKTRRTNHFESGQCTPVRANIINDHSDNIKTPMLPPKSLPRKMAGLKTPNSTMKVTSSSKNVLANHLVICTPTDEEINGRASIARLRAQNAGMVMAKAKLFDKLSAYSHFDNESHPEQSQSVTQSYCNRRKSNLSRTSEIDAIERNPVFEPAQTLTVSKPTDSSRERQSCLKQENKATYSPGYVQKRHKISSATRYPNKQILEKIAADEKLTQTRQVNDSFHLRNLSNVKIRGAASPSTSRNHKYFNHNSPRRARTQANINSYSRKRTPLKPSAQAIQKNSPSLSKIKPANRKAVSKLS